MMLKFYTALTVFVNFLIVVDSKITFRNIECATIDKSFTNMEYCYIKAVNRSYKYISIKAQLYRIPITNISVGINLMKKANGYKPFLYNITFDGCKFLRERKNPLIGFFYTFMEPFTNANHTCPYDHDLIVEKLSTTWVERSLEKLPLPPGDYAVFTKWYAYNVLRATIIFHGSQIV